MLQSQYNINDNKVVLDIQTIITNDGKCIAGTMSREKSLTVLYWQSTSYVLQKV